MITGYTHPLNSEKITADKSQWMIFLFRNFDKVIRIIIELSNNLKCVVCQDLSLNYTAKSSLARHYRVYHRKSTAEYFIKHVVPLSPDELTERFEKVRRLIWVWNL